MLARRHPDKVLYWPLCGAHVRGPIAVTNPSMCVASPQPPHHWGRQTHMASEHLEEIACLAGQRPANSNPSPNREDHAQRRQRSGRTSSSHNQERAAQESGRGVHLTRDETAATCQSLTLALTASTGQEASSRMRWALDPRISLPTGVRRRRPITMKSALTSLATSIRSCEGSLPRTSWRTSCSTPASSRLFWTVRSSASNRRASSASKSLPPRLELITINLVRRKSDSSQARHNAARPSLVGT